MGKRSDSRRSPQRRTPPVATPPSKGPKRRRIPVALLALLAILAIRGGFEISARWRKPDTKAPEDSVATLDAREALVRGVALDRQGRHPESLPYFRRAAEAGSGWLVHWDYAGALNNAAIAVANRRGVGMPSTRSSVERLRAVHAALDQVIVAEREARDNVGRARMEVVRGSTLDWWGFPVDALVAYRAAATLEPGNGAANQSVALALARLRGAQVPARDPHP